MSSAESKTTGGNRRRRVLILAALFIALAAVAAGYFIREWRKTDRLLAEGEQKLAAREYAQARESFERYLAERPADTRARLLAARAARHQRFYRDAREHLQRAAR